MKSGRERAQELREQLQLQHLNLEAGHFRLLGESAIPVNVEGETLQASNVIYLMLDEIEPINYVQWLASDDIQVLIEGGPADYYLFLPDGTTQKITMGRNLAAGEQMIVHAPAATAKAIVLHDDADYLLVGSIVTPAWTPTRVRIGTDAAFVNRYQNTSAWATEDRLRELIGPNFGHIAGGDRDSMEIQVETGGNIIFQGMQLSRDQANRELQRFAQRHPGHTVSIGYETDAPQELIEGLKSKVASLDLDLVVMALGDGHSARD